MLYSVSSSGQVTLTPRDVHSQVICEVAHVSMQRAPPLCGTAKLSDTNLRYRTLFPAPGHTGHSGCCSPGAIAPGPL